MLSIRSIRATSRAPLASVARQVRRHRAITRTSVAALALAVATAVSAGGSATAGLAAVLAPPASILPGNVGQGIGTLDAVELAFSQPMDAPSVAEALLIAPAHDVRLQWSSDSRTLVVEPASRWLTDHRYLLTVGAEALRADGLALAEVQRFSFTTETAPRITDFEVRRVAGGQGVEEFSGDDTSAASVGLRADTAADASASTSVVIAFSTEMNRDEVERGFTITPAVPGVFVWSGSTMTFSPAERLASDARYAVTVAGAHDRSGNPLGGDQSFSFTTRAGAQVVKVSPGIGATGVSPTEVTLWFSQRVNAPSVAAALSVRDATAGSAVSGTAEWNAATTQLRFVPARALAAGHRFEIALLPGAIDLDGNAIEMTWAFTTKGAAARPRVAIPPTPSSPTLVGYALNQVNTARAAYGLGPLVLDAALTATATAHSWEMVQYNYFSHNSLDGTSYQQRLRNAGLGYGWSGENICSSGRGGAAGLDWCHATFMAEPYPGYANHIGNILSTHFTRIGIGIAESGSRIVITWDFTD